MEEWKTIDRRPSYEVSNNGRVRNKETKHILSTRNTPTGYALVDLKRGQKITTYVHRLVAEAFVANPDSLPQVNHKDEDKSNNSATNLEWCSAAYNNAYGTHCDKMRETKRKLYGIPVAKIDKATGKTIAIYPTSAEAAQAHGVTRQAIYWALKAKHHTAAGYRWEVVK